MPVRSSNKTTAKAAPAKRTTRKAATPAKAAPAKATRAPRKAAAAAVEAVADITADTDLFASFLGELRDLVDKYLSPIGTTAKSAPAEEPEDEPDEDEETDEGVEDEDALPTKEERIEALTAMTIRALRKVAIDTDELDEDEVKTETDKGVLIDSIIEIEAEKGLLADEEADEEESDDEESEEDEGDEDGDEYSRETLMGLNIRELRKLATSDRFGIDAAEVKSADKDTIIDLILGEGEDGDEADDEDEDADEYWTEDELRAMPLAEVKGIADDAGIKYTARQGKDIEWLIAQITAEDDE